jgi:hypothetical protein
VVDGKRLDFKDTDPVMENSRVLVPMRAKSFRAEVSWDDETRTVIINAASK